ncbi:hypothetical protein HYX15_03735 [Candidatus Woesearchaeota archaeon]|nr:hypothetical protein [Candidatus Woesearchaeota archaeon]
MGEAYGFFDCRATKEAIEAELPTIRRLVETPSGLELSLTEGMDNVRGDSKLVSLAREAGESGIKYMLKANYPDADNNTTADELAGILNQAYQSPLYKKGEEFKGTIVYEEKGDYIFRE